MIVSIQQDNQVLNISYINRDGFIGILNYNIPQEEMFDYYDCSQPMYAIPDLKSWDDKYVTRKSVNYLSDHRIKELFIKYPDIFSCLFEFNKPKLYSFDIEVEVTDSGFPDAESASNRVTCIALSCFPTVVAFGCKPLSDECIKDINLKINEHIKSKGKEFKFIYRYHEREEDLLLDFFYNYVRHIPLLTGWNIWGYDLPYLYNRCKKLNIDISFLSPTGMWKPFTVREKYKSYKLPMPMHKLMVDYMKIYQKWDRTIDIKENDTLDYVAEAGLGFKKIKYAGTLRDLYQRDYPLYVLYCCIDTIIVELLDDRLKTMNTFLGLGNLTRVESLQAFSPINMLSSALNPYTYSENKVFPLRKRDGDDGDDEGYEGAFVFEPKSGAYRGVASYDFASLYPTTQRQFNISFENFIRKDPNYVVTPGCGVIKCASGALFKADRQYLLPTLLSDYYAKRKSAKKVMINAEKDINVLKEILKERIKKSQTI